MALTAQIAECLTLTLNPDTNTRIAAELKLAEYFASPGSPHSINRIRAKKPPSRSLDAGLSTSQLILAQTADMPLRQISFSCFLAESRLLI